MASGYRQVINRLSCVSSFGPPLVPDELDVLRINLQSFFFKSSVDADTRSLAFENFAIPSLLVSLYGHLLDDCARVRLNEFLFNEYPRQEPSYDVRERAVISALTMIIDFGSVADHELTSTELQSFMFDVFTGMETFMTATTPQSPFINFTVDLSKLGDYFDSISVSTLDFNYYLSNHLYFRSLTGLVCASWIQLQFTGVDMLV